MALVEKIVKKTTITDRTDITARKRDFESALAEHCEAQVAHTDRSATLGLAVVTEQNTDTRWMQVCPDECTHGGAGKWDW